MKREHPRHRMGRLCGWVGVVGVLALALPEAALAQRDMAKESATDSNVSLSIVQPTSSVRMPGSTRGRHREEMRWNILVRITSTPPRDDLVVKLRVAPKDSPGQSTEIGALHMGSGVYEADWEVTKSKNSYRRHWFLLDAREGRAQPRAKKSPAIEVDVDKREQTIGLARDWIGEGPYGKKPCPWCGLTVAGWICNHFAWHVYARVGFLAEGYQSPMDLTTLYNNCQNYDDRRGALVFFTMADPPADFDPAHVGIIVDDYTTRMVDCFNNPHEGDGSPLPSGVNERDISAGTDHDGYKDRKEYGTTDHGLNP
ncbi:MAG: hypothetical protein HY321_20685 [Armatimonadetes bacterium]|nr:hypothetical protein [Armatimonadota bacterium]